MADQSEPVVVFMTAANREEAGRLAEMLVTQKLAACVQILPEMESVYRWQGQIERQNEILLIAKTRLSEFAALEREVRKIHSYENPEIVACPISAGSAPYLKWLSEGVEAVSS
ncbi:MAG TPA: divalent-cation tolerance protein CutA [Pyrinomonadaceae bacterium]|nr:divalent-cation tolerance protein CutA [Pyrinomonadaceae bacterium]